MKRDLELIRKILLLLESSPHGQTLQAFSIEGYDAEAIGYHAYLMLQAGLVRGADTSQLSSSIPIAIITGLTWHGHDFLDLAKDEPRWAKAMKIAKETGGSITIDLVKELLASLARSAIGVG